MQCTEGSLLLSPDVVLVSPPGSIVGVDGAVQCSAVQLMLNLLSEMTGMR